MATNDQWLARVQEATLEPDLPICDPHHHLWDQRHDRVEPRYLLDEILADLNSGHRIVSTVFIQCGAMYKATGPEAMRVIGETEFVNGIAAMSASGLYGPTRIAAGIVGMVDLTLGDNVVPVLEAHQQAGVGRFRGIRHIVAWMLRGRRSRAVLCRRHTYTSRQRFAEDSPSARYEMSFEACATTPRLLN
jgi:predicted TIM-barrel fold metal-dependent hydrolase